MRDFKTSLPSAFLPGYHKGTMAYAYKGIACWKNPIDLAVYLRLLWDLKPGGVIEIGSNAGGSALWLADTLRAYGLAAPVISVDLTPPTGVADTQITFLSGDVHDLASALSERLADLPHPWLAIDDSAHTFSACSAALAFFAGAMLSGDMLVVEDGVIDDMGLTETYGGGPNRAVREFLASNPGIFEIETRYCDMFGPNVTYNPNGYLRRT